MTAGDEVSGDVAELNGRASKRILWLGIGGLVWAIEQTLRAIRMTDKLQHYGGQ